jgi:hypothetical protein
MIYRLKASIPGSKVFTRVYEVPSNMTLFSFNAFIANDLDFSPDQMVLYRGINARGETSSTYGMFDLGDGSMDMITFESVASKDEIGVQFCYHIRNNSCIDILFDGEEVGSPRVSYPRLVESKGQNPDQFALAYIDPVVYTKDELDNIDPLDDYDDEPEDDSDMEEIYGTDDEA